MQNLPAVPELRSPRTIVREWRREAAHIEIAVAIVLALSICALLLVITRESPLASAITVALA